MRMIDRVLLRVGHCLRGVIVALAFTTAPVVYADEARDALPGLYAVMEPNFTQARQTYLNSLWPIVRDALVSEREVVGGVKRDITSNGSLMVSIKNTDEIEHGWRTVSEALSRQTQIAGLDGAAYDVKVELGRIIASFDAASSDRISNHLSTKSLVALQSRLKDFGHDDAQVAQYKSSKIQIVAPYLEDPAAFISLLSNQGQLTGYSVVSKQGGAKPHAGIGQRVLTDRSDKDTHYVVEDKILLSNEHFKEFEGTFDANGRPSIRFWLMDNGIQAFDAVRGQYPGGLTAFVFDNEVISVLGNDVVRIPSNEGLMVNSAGIQDARLTARLLNSGPLPASIRMIELREISQLSSH